MQKPEKIVKNKTFNAPSDVHNQSTVGQKSNGTIVTLVSDRDRDQLYGFRGYFLG